jgi:hypothetical protein
MSLTAVYQRVPEGYMGFVEEDLAGRDVIREAFPITTE